MLSVNVFLLDASYERVYESCDVCARKTIIQNGVDKCAEGNCHVGGCGDYLYTMVLIGIDESGNRIMFRDPRFIPFLYFKTTVKSPKHITSMLKRKFKSEVVVNDRTSPKRSMRGFLPEEVMWVGSPFVSVLDSVASYLRSIGCTVYDNGIRYDDKYLSWAHIRLGSWVTVHCTPTVAHIGKIDREFVVHDYTTLERDDIPDPSVLCFDIECKSHDEKAFPDPYNATAEVYMICAIYRSRDVISKMCYCLTTIANDVEYRKFDTEFALIIAFFEDINSLDPDIITGYNVLSFDFSYIYRRICYMIDTHFNLSRIRGYRGYFRELEWSSSAYGNNAFFMPTCFGRMLLDVMQYVKREMRFQKVSLAYVSERILGNTKIDLTPKEMFACMKTNDALSIRTVAEYCMRDVELTLAIFDKSNMWYGCVELSRLTDTRIEELYTRGESRKILMQLYRECYLSDVVMQDYTGCAYKFQGAFVMDPVVGLHQWCTVLDFSSLYPSIVISNNICYTTYTDNRTRCHEIAVDGTIHRFVNDRIGVVPGLLKTLLDERKRYKGLIKMCMPNSTLAMIYDKRQNALKICANSIYGCFGTRSIAALYFPQGAACVTSMGRMYVSQTKSIIENDHGYRVLYGDTDSCMVQIPATSLDECFAIGRDIARTVSERFPIGVSLEMDSIYRTILFITKKRYAGIDAKTGSVKIKGLVSVRGDTCVFIKNVNNAVVRMILEGVTKNELERYTADMIASLRNGTIDLGNLYMSTTLKGNYASDTCPTAVFMVASATNGRRYAPGTKIDYLVVESEERLQGYKWRDVVYFDECNESIDRKFYEDRLNKSLKGILSILE